MFVEALETRVQAPLGAAFQAAASLITCRSSGACSMYRSDFYKHVAPTELLGNLFARLR